MTVPRTPAGMPLSAVPPWHRHDDAAEARSTGPPIKAWSSATVAGSLSRRTGTGSCTS